jgi:two-component system sensor histidine kinase BaeS
MVSIGSGRVRWYRSFYFRIGFSFVVFVVAVLAAQSAMFSYMIARSRPFPFRAPNNVAAIVAADIGAALAQDPGIDLQEYVTREFAQLQPMYLVMTGDRVVANRPEPLATNLRRSADALLAGRNFPPGDEPKFEGPGVVMAPIQVGGTLRGMVVLPPRAPASPLAREVGRMLSIPGTMLLIIGTIIAAAFIFAPARRRLRALEAATERLGAGDLSARAPETGGDEIAHVARAFNRMAAELSARDEAVRTVDRLRRQMLADVSHELKTPLTAMCGYLETLQMPDLALDAETRERYLQTLERETRRLDRIVQDLVDLARLENGVGLLDVRVFALERLFGHVVQRHDQDARAREVALRVSVAPEADQVLGDPDRLEQVVENLVANALRHTPPGGHVEMCGRAEGDAIVLTVADSGTGIAPEHVPHVFERFYKVDAARTRDANGSGLGLSIAKAIVERHQGTIQVTSVPGRTAFTIILPRQQVERTAHSTSANM